MDQPNGQGGPDDGATIELTKEGGLVQLHRRANRTVYGGLVMPATFSETGERQVVSMEGTWELVDGIVSFDQAEDTVVRDIAFTASEGRLEGGRDFGDERVTIVLEPGAQL